MMGEDADCSAVQEARSRQLLGEVSRQQIVFMAPPGASEVDEVDMGVDDREARDLQNRRAERRQCAIAEPRQIRHELWSHAIPWRNEHRYEALAVKITHTSKRLGQFLQHDLAPAVKTEFLFLLARRRIVGVRPAMDSG